MTTGRISQELFDETVLENEDVFELSPEEALEETLKQYGHLDLSHLLTSHPSCHQQERQERQEFVQLLEKLKDRGCDEEENVTVMVEAFETIQACIQANPSAYLVLLLQHDGMTTLVSLFNHTSTDTTTLLESIMETLICILTPKTQNKSSVKQVQSELRNGMNSSAMTHWMDLFVVATATCGGDLNHHHHNIQSLFLQLAFVSCRYNEANKKEWMHAARLCQGGNGIDALLGILKQPRQEETNTTTTTTSTCMMIRACHVITTLCKFDDFRAPTSNTAAPIVSSANEHAMEFARHGAVQVLYQVASNETSSTKDNTQNKRLLAASLSALRVLAIHNDQVQSMVAVGVLQLVETTLSCYSHSNANVAAATLGLARNLSANDDVKTTLCGKDGLVHDMLQAMQVHAKHAHVQEHGCGTMAAMALRKPSNALRLVKTFHAHLRVLDAMRLNLQNATVQRQGALALRNFASRACPTDGIVEILLNAGAEQVLRQAGETHQSCIDESYAALRDLGCNAKVIKYTKNDVSGEMEQGTTKMFGETKPNFRPVLEESSNTA